MFDLDLNWECLDLRSTGLGIGCGDELGQTDAEVWLAED